MNADLELALELADEADALTLGRFRAADLVVDTKPDLTPVSEADRAVEERLRRHLARARPGHGVLGEEMGDHAGAAIGWRWVVDPIDGTKNYVRGVPVWATLIALQHAGRTVVGVVSAPALGRRWWAARGEGAFADGDRVRVSEVAALADASLSYASLTGWEAAGRGEAFLALARRFWRTRAYGDFWSHVLVAEGAVDVAAEPEVTLWDLAALQVIVEEAGGRFTDLRGRPTAAGGSAVTSNGRLHEQVLAVLGGKALPPR
ncbi:MAG TPA: histidinol-phosphatase [Acidimicrobiales bacterium]|nr:histidinol-phosphatase [Acidimicrobiales bacterium]